MDDVMDAGQWLVEHRVGLDRGEAEWLRRLAEFDREGLWALDGHFCCATWLVWRTNMKRSTAFEKLRVAHELHRRPIVGDAFARGAISYSAVRAITRMERPDAAVDEAMVALASSGTASILDVERAVRSYGLYADQDRPPADDAKWARDVKIPVAHTVSSEGEPLHLGRKTREWSTAQRRAIAVRDRGHCRFPGCGFTHYDIHHMRPWEAGGPTDIDNGFSQCRRHHRMLHAGYQVEGDPNGELAFYRPDGTYIGSTHPAMVGLLAGV
ncbi:MAG TPA: DUF222 domain-containing protein [Acidimicrobiales bacterium]|nr:DUF222 domain-containing protein [Acidimicrobiales bacterium]